MVLPLPASDKIDKPTNQYVAAAEWNQLVQAVAELQSAPGIPGPPGPPGVTGDAVGRDPRDYGAVGDGTHDDTGAFQAALDDLLVDEASRGKISGLYVPPGRWRITAPLSLEGRAFVIFGAGSRVSFIDSTFNDYVFKKIGGQPIVLHPTIRDLTILNRGALGGCLQIAGTHELVLQRVYIQGHIGLWRGLPAGTPGDGGFTTGLYDCTFRLSGNYAGSIGVTGHNHILLVGCDANGIETAFQLGGMNVNVIGGRTEVCKTGFRLGVDEQGSANGWLGVHSGHYFEACDVAIDVVAGAGTIRDCRVYGTTNAPASLSQYGIRLPGSGSAVALENCVVSGSFARSAVFASRPQDATATSVRSRSVAVRLRDVAATNVVSGVPGRTLDFQQPYSVVVEGGNASADLLKILSPVRAAADAPVVAGSTYLDVVFPAAWPAGTAFAGALASATPGIAGTGTLAAGNYFYISTFVNAAGEGFPATDQGVYYVRSAAVPESGSVALAFVGGAVPPGIWRRRIYRGRGVWAGGANADLAVFDGYYDLPVGSSAPFIDMGGPLTGLGSPRLGEHGELGWIEADAAYRVDVRPDWGTTVWVSDRTAAGFRINFGTAAPEGATLDWELVR